MSNNHHSQKRALYTVQLAEMQFNVCQWWRGQPSIIWWIVCAANVLFVDDVANYSLCKLLQIYNWTT